MIPHLSIIIPAYNAEETATECLQSVLIDSEACIEVIVVDDGSTDDTVGACTSLGSPLVSVHSQKNSGVSGARNAGVRLATGDYVMFVDADDALAPGWFAKVQPFLSSGEDIVVFMDGLRKERYEVDELVESIVGANPRRDMKPGKPPVKWAASPFSRIYSRRFLKTGGLKFDPRIINGEDALLNLEAFLKSDRIRFVGESIYRYRIHGASATHTFDRRFFVSNEAYLAKLEALLGESGRYSKEEVASLVDFSFCRSIEIMALRAAWGNSAPDRRRAVADVNADPLVQKRLAAVAHPDRNPLHELVVYALTRAGRLNIAVALLRTALAAKGRSKSQERWVSI